MEFIIGIVLIKILGRESWILLLINDSPKVLICSSAADILSIAFSRKVKQTAFMVRVMAVFTHPASGEDEDALRGRFGRALIGSKSELSVFFCAPDKLT